MTSWASRFFGTIVLLSALSCSSGGARAQHSASSATVLPSQPSLVPSAATPPATTANPFEFDPAFFKAKGPHQPGDWLSEHHEHGQTFLEFQRSSTLRPSAERRTIVLQPLGELTDEQRALLSTLQRASGLFFGLPVEIAEPQPIPSAGRRVRQRRAGPTAQYLTRTILDSLAKHTPERAVAYLGVTFQDLYPEASWNFVFGEAELSARVGVYSLLRFTPQFNHEPNDASARRRLLRRAIQLLAHETGHIFGLEHDTAFECVMNGTNSLEESDQLPIEPCQVCLHKLAFALRIQPLPRYRELGQFYEELGLVDDARWLRARYASLAP